MKRTCESFHCEVKAEQYLTTEGANWFDYVEIPVPVTTNLNTSLQPIQ